MARLPLISAFEYTSGTIAKMFFADVPNIYDVSTTTPITVASGRTSGNYAASQLANAAGDWLLVVNDATRRLEHECLLYRWLACSRHDRRLTLDMSHCAYQSRIRHLCRGAFGQSWAMDA